MLNYRFVVWFRIRRHFGCFVFEYSNFILFTNLVKIFYFVPVDLEDLADHPLPARPERKIIFVSAEAEQAVSGSQTIRVQKGVILTLVEVLGCYCVSYLMLLQESALQLPFVCVRSTFCRGISRQTSWRLGETKPNPHDYLLHNISAPKIRTLSPTPPGIPFIPGTPG